MYQTIYYRWGTRDFDSEKELIDAITDVLQVDLDDRPLPIVTVRGKTRRIKIHVTLESE